MARYSRSIAYKTYPMPPLPRKDEMFAIYLMGCMLSFGIYQTVEDENGKKIFYGFTLIMISLFSWVSIGMLIGQAINDKNKVI